MKWDFVAMGGVFSCSLHEGRAGSLGRWEEGVPPSPPPLGPLPLLCVPPTGSLGRTQNCKCRAGAVTVHSGLHLVCSLLSFGGLGSALKSQSLVLETRGIMLFKGALKDPSLPLLPFSGSSLKPACVCHSWYKAIVEHPLLGSRLSDK